MVGRVHRGFLRCLLAVPEHIQGPETGPRFSPGGGVCHLGCGVSGMERPGSEGQQRPPDRALRPPAWLPGTVFTECSRGHGAGGERVDPLLSFLEGQEAAHGQQSLVLAQGECRCWGDPTPGVPMQHQGPHFLEASLAS